MPRFTQDNTEGYTDAQLEALNDRYEAAVSEALGEDADPEDLETGSQLDHVAERVLAEYDRGER